MKKSQEEGQQYIAS